MIIMREGGGLALYASEDINIERLPDIEPEDSEIMCFEFQLPNKVNKFVFLAVCYRPQDRSIIDFGVDFQDVLDYTENKGYYNVLFVGDFNCKNPEWCQGDRMSMEGGIFKTFLDTKGLSQLVNFPTRFDIENNRSSCLDLIITTDKSFVNDVSSYGPVANCDHIPVSFRINCKLPKIQSFHRNVWNFKRGDFNRLNVLLSDYPWDTLFVLDNIHDIVGNWTDAFLEMAKECIPYTQILVRPDELPYMTSYLRSLIRRKDRLFKQWVRTKKDTHREYYRVLRNDCTLKLRQAEANYIQSQCDSLELDSSTKKWWNTVKKLCCFKKTSNTIAPIVNTDGILVYDAETKADIFNQFYAGVSTINDPDSPIPTNNIATGPLLDSISISQHQVYELLSKLDTSKATGPDNIGNMLLKNCAPSISKVLTKIFNLSLALGEFPNSWKIAHIVPIHKKGSVHDYKMYRPVSLLPCVSKVFEKLIFQEVYLHLRRNNIISPFQSGFTPGDSTINQLIHINDRLLKSLDNFDDAIGCFLDLTRAFDTVWHKGLLYKLEKYGIRDHANGSKTLSWFTSYLHERGHRVTIDGKQSNIRYINSAVPQGSVLGPLLFLIYINDITDGIESDIFLFADDTSIFRSGNDNKQLANGINSDLNKITLWARKWKITINPTKTVAMLFSKKPRPVTDFQIRLGNDIIQLSDHHKHLGLWLTSNLNWKKHINEVATKARKRLGCISKHKYRMSRRGLELCYLTFIRPVLEYGNVLYDSATNEDLEVLSKIEVEAMRVITGARKRCNLQALSNEFKWPDLEERRKNQKIVTLCKVITKKFPPYLLDDLPQFYDNARNVRRNTFAVPRCIHDYYSRSYIPSSVELWNNLPANVRCINSHKAIKARLKNSSTTVVPKYYSYGPRKLNVLQCKLRLGCSDLNQDKHLIGISNTDLCVCGEIESADHYLLQCGNNLVSKIKMLDSITAVLEAKGMDGGEIDQFIDVNLLLKGNADLSYEENTQIFSSVQTFIKESKRFT